MATTDELRILLRTIADTGGATQVRQAIRGVQDEARRADSGPLSALGLNTSQGFLRASLALAGLSAGLNVASGLASSLHDQLARGIQGAIDLAETMNKVDVVFGSAGGTVKALGQDAATALGTTQNAALAAAGSFGNLFVSMGLTQKQAADMSVRMVRLAADLASFNNIRPEDALQKLQSGLVGETEPLRALGIALNETQTQAKAMALGFQPVNGQLTEAAKVQARYALILDQSKTAQGDFARTSDGLANQQRIAAAAIEETAAAVGDKLLPTLKDATGAAIDLARVLKDVLPPAIDVAVQSAKVGFPLLGALAGGRQSLRDLAQFKDQLSERNRTEQAEAEALIVAQRNVGLAYDEQGQAIDALTGKVLGFEDAQRRAIQATRDFQTGAPLRAAARSLPSADIDFLTGKIGAGPLAGAALDEALRKAAEATREINAENRARPLPADTLKTDLERQLAILEDQRSQAARENVDLALREAEARLRLLPIQQELADLQREISNNQNKALQLTREEAVLRAQQAANPANDALDDVRTAERRLQLVIATTRGAERSAARRELRGLIRSRAEQKAELAALDASGPLVAAQRAARDTALTTQIANIPNLIKAAKLEVDAQPLESALEQVRAQIQTDTAERAKVTAGLDKSITSLSDDIKILNSLLTGKPTGLYVPGADRNANGGFVNLGGTYSPQAPQPGAGYYRLEVVLNTDGVQQTIFNNILQGESNARMPTAALPGGR